MKIVLNIERVGGGWEVYDVYHPIDVFLWLAHRAQLISSGHSVRTEWFWGGVT